MNTRTIPMKGRIGLLAAASLLAAILVAVPAQAALPTLPWNPTDGVADTNATIQTVPDLSGNSKELGPKNGNVYKLQTINTTPLPVLDYTNPNAGTDFTQIRIDSATVNGDVWGYFAFTIESFTTGQSAWEFMSDPAPAGCDYSQPNSYLIAHCNPWANRQAGDFFIVADYQGNGVSLGYRVWQDAGGGALTLGPLTAIPADHGDGGVNTATGYVEMAVNLTQAVFGGAQRCTSIGNIIPSTLTGNSDNADYKDVVLADLTATTAISNCGSVTISKVLNSSHTYDDTYQYTLDRAGADMRYAADTSTGNPANDDTGYVVPGANGAAGTAVTETRLIAGTDYTLTELIGAGTDTVTSTELVSIICTPEGGSPIDLSTATYFPVDVGKTTACVITNKERAGTLTVYKDVQNDNGGSATYADFAFALVGHVGTYSWDPDAADLDNEDGVKSLTLPAGTYTAQESTVATGYTEDNSDCVDVVVPAGGTASCTIVNTDDPAALTVDKVVDNHAGGAAAAADFSVTLKDSTPATIGSQSFVNDDGTTLTGSTEFSPLNVGTYDVTEDGAVWVTDHWQITKGGVVYYVTYSDCSAISLGLGGSGTCTVTNTAQPASPGATTAQSWVLHDSVTFTGVRSGAPNAPTQVTFGLYTDSACSGSPVGEETVDLTGNQAATATGVTITSLTPNDTFYWKVVRPADDYNNAVTYCNESTQIIADDSVN
ncbi:hypothetical protein RN607_04115 [Demequina capsici]|uniref:SpaA-like prealbumin fold domain-containing protein n=1 Tax=Demequina capsici TaxID=3075620 RepID=A0AA96FEM6_9MICO|nr:hypothetical protein [Demequina sp. PMTSA13]WNM28195.1 hypothetical protein RN607_04115 [Demequina sp. PMTSA13]